MKKLLALLLTMVMAFSLVACGGEEAKIDGKETEENKTIEVDENLITVDITLPASFFEMLEESAEEWRAEADTNIFTKIVVNEDGSAVITTTKAKHRELLKNMIDSINTMFPNENFASIKSVNMSDNGKTVTVKVDKNGFENSFDALGLMAMDLTVAMYQGFNPDVTSTAVIVLDEATGEEISTYSLPEKYQE